jgi:hypothetical protein
METRQTGHFMGNLRADGRAKARFAQGGMAGIGDFERVFS